MKVKTKIFIGLALIVIISLGLLFLPAKKQEIQEAKVIKESKEDDPKIQLEIILSESPIELMNAKIINPVPNILAKRNDGAEVYWKIEVTYKQDDYYKLLPRIQSLLKQISKDKADNDISVQGDLDDDGYIFSRKLEFYEIQRRLEKKYNFENFRLVFLNIGRNDKADNLRWNWYVIEKEHWDPIYKKIEGLRYPLRVELMGSGKDIVNSQDADLYSFERYRNNIEPALEQNVFPCFLYKCHSEGYYLISPFFYEHCETYFDRFSFDHIVDLSSNDIKKIKEIKCGFFLREKTALE